MLIVMTAQATPADIERVCKKIEALGFRPHAMPGAQKTAIGIRIADYAKARNSGCDAIGCRVV